MDSRASKWAWWATFGVTVASLVVAVVMSLGGWAEAAEYRMVFVLMAATGTIVAVAMGGRRLVYWHRKQRLARESRSPDSEIAFREGFHGAADGFVVNTELRGSKTLLDIRDAAGAKFAERIVAFPDIVEWLSRGAPDPISGNQTVPRAALRKYRQGSRKDWIKPEQMAAQLIESGVFDTHPPKRAAKGLTWGR
ncbi:MAG: hypothetical protein F4Y02_07895 [Chloroflexi bacterium]|nr:hypothetical protein [Chloroflexota bacterium]